MLRFVSIFFGSQPTGIEWDKIVAEIIFLGHTRGGMHENVHIIIIMIGLDIAFHSEIVPYS